MLMTMLMLMILKKSTHKTAGDAEPDSGVPHRPQMSPLTACSGVRSVFVFREVLPRNRRSFGFFEGAQEERTKRQLLLRKEEISVILLVIVRLFIKTSFFQG